MRFVDRPIRGQERTQWNRCGMTGCRVLAAGHLAQFQTFSSSMTRVGRFWRVEVWESFKTSLQPRFPAPHCLTPSWVDVGTVGSNGEAANTSTSNRKGPSAPVPSPTSRGFKPCSNHFASELLRSARWFSAPPCPSARSPGRTMARVCPVIWLATTPGPRAKPMAADPYAFSSIGSASGNAA